MPHFTLNIGAGGLVMDVAIGVSQPRQDALTLAGAAIPQPIIIRGLVDTGASHTCIDPAVLAALSLTPTGMVPVLTPSTGAVPVNQEQYDVSITLLSPTLTWSFRSVAATKSDLAVQGIQALIGRDVLGQCVLIYNGSLSIFTLAF